MRVEKWKPRKSMRNMCGKSSLSGFGFSEVKMASRNPKPLLVTLFANWVVAPIIMTLYANVLLAGNPQYIAGVILLGLSPCTAMVMWWMLLAKGNMAQGLIKPAVHAMFMLILYAPLAALFLAVSS